MLRPPVDPERGAPAYFRVLRFAFCILLPGCCYCPPPPAPKTAYFGPTLPINEVVNRVNANNQKIRSLWSNQRFQAQFVDDKGHPRAVDGDGVLLYLKPDDLYLRGDVIGAGEAFSLGTTRDRYWLKIVQGADALWTGTYANAARVDPRELPIRPDLVLEVLGVSDLNTNLLEPPAPVMRFDNYRDAYVLLWSAPAPGHLVAQREIWYDRSTLLPEQVTLYDGNGRMALEAHLFDPRPIPEQQGEEPTTDSPRIATRFQLFFPQTQTHMNLSLFNMSFTKNRVPTGKTFDRLVSDLAKPGVSHVYDLDREARVEQ